MRCRTRCQSGKPDDDRPRADDECRFVMDAEDINRNTLRVPANWSMNVRPAASTIVGAWVSTELTVSATASAANADVAPAKLLDAGVAATPLTVIDQMRSGDSSGEERLATVLMRCFGRHISGSLSRHCRCCSDQRRVHPRNHSFLYRSGLMAG